MVKQKITPISKGETKDIRLRKGTAIQLERAKLDQGLITYDDIVTYLLKKVKTK
jgi:hypothetical protein